MGKHKEIPDRWMNYTPIGKQIKGTRFIAFKVPLRKRVCNSVDDSSITLHVDKLLDRIPKLGLVIDLTNTTRYYDPEHFSRNRVQYKKLACPGGNVTPSSEIRNKFDRCVKKYLDENRDNDKLIGVHCTHGVNRTGYLICSYMVVNLNMDPLDAIASFEQARGHRIERDNYRNGILSLRLMFKRQPSRHIESSEKDDERNHSRQSRRSNETILDRIMNGISNKSKHLSNDTNDRNVFVMPHSLKWSAEKYHDGQHRTDRYDDGYSRSRIETESFSTGRRISSPIRSTDREYNRAEKSDDYITERRGEEYDNNGQWYANGNNFDKNVYRFHNNERPATLYHHSQENSQEFRPPAVQASHHDHMPDNRVRNFERQDDYREMHGNAIEHQYHTVNRKFPLFKTPDSAMTYRYKPQNYDNATNNTNPNIQRNYNTFRWQNNNQQGQQRFPNRVTNWVPGKNGINHPTSSVPKFHPYDRSRGPQRNQRGGGMFPAWRRN